MLWQYVALETLNGGETLARMQKVLTHADARGAADKRWRIPVVAYSGKQRAEIQFPEVTGSKLVEFIPKSVSFPELKIKTEFLIEELKVAA